MVNETTLHTTTSALFHGAPLVTPFCAQTGLRHFWNLKELMTGVCGSPSPLVSEICPLPELKSLDPIDCAAPSRLERSPQDSTRLADRLVCFSPTKLLRSNTTCNFPPHTHLQSEFSTNQHAPRASTARTPRFVYPFPTFSFSSPLSLQT